MFCLTILQDNGKETDVFISLRWRRCLLAWTRQLDIIGGLYWVEDELITIVENLNNCSHGQSYFTPAHIVESPASDT